MITLSRRNFNAIALAAAVTAPAAGRGFAAAKPTNLVSWIPNDGQAHVAYQPDIP